jgi:50S ribosomal subunit-associated GTPase HflX
VVFAVNKVDLVEGSAASEAEEELAKDFRGSVEYTSALTGEAVQRLFRKLAAEILKIQA